MIGIYKITNKINHKVYIGQSIDIKRRWRSHRESFENNTKDTILIKAVQKYGIENFIFEVLEECDVNELDSKEQFYIAYYNSYNNGYNMSLGGQQGNHGWECKISNTQLLEIYDLLINSNLSQKEIAQLYSVGQDTISEINNGKTRTLPGYNYPLRQNWKREIIVIDGKEQLINANLICPKCGNLKKTREKGLCQNCQKIARRKVERPDAVTLAREIVETNFCAVGRKYGVSDNAIRKWCKSYGLPTTKNELKDWLSQVF